MVTPERSLSRALVIALALAGCTRAAPAPTPAKPAVTLPADGDTPLPLETACSTDDDCVHDYRYLIDGKCCSGTCSPRAANRSYAAKVDARCQELGWEKERCPMKKCVPPPKVRCASGTCTLE